MAVFYINVFQYDRQLRKTWKHGNVHLPDFDGCIQVLIGLMDKLTDDLLFK